MGFGFGKLCCIFANDPGLGALSSHMMTSLRDILLKTARQRESDLCLSRALPHVRTTWMGPVSSAQGLKSAFPAR